MVVFLIMILNRDELSVTVLKITWMPSIILRSCHRSMPSYNMSANAKMSAPWTEHTTRFDLRRTKERTQA